METDVRIRDSYEDYLGVGSTRDTQIQIVFSLVLGIGAFFAFCILRPRWTGLYAARKQQKDEASSLPDLPSSLFGWMPTLWRITEQQVLASAGLDAYVFLRFFKLAIKFLLVALFFALTIIKPVHDNFDDGDDGKGDKNKTKHSGGFYDPERFGMANLTKRDDLFTVLKKKSHYQTDYLWMYLVFTYLFTGFLLYLIVSETRKVIEVRQEYLGSQTTITDRTIRLSGIPPELRSEEKIKTFVEELEIGKVESVMLCRNWKELDNAMVKRSTILRRLEEAWTVYLGHRRVERNLESLPITQPPPPGPPIAEEEDDERSRLLGNGSTDPSHVTPYARTRPTIRIWYGRFKLRYHLVDAIDYYEEKLRRVDEQIKQLRNKDFAATPLAFVTMDSIASCQMAIQAVLDPSPLELQAKPSPAPADVIWPNTYISRYQRMAQSWSITILIAILTVFWSVILVPIATALDVHKIAKVWPQLADLLESQKIALSLLQTQLTTLLITLFNVLGPYLYEWLSNLQGMVSQGDVELSVISKNFFFTFVNFFVVFTALGTAALSSWEKFGEGSIRDTTMGLARSLTNLRKFYVNYIILQGVGLFPFRLLEFGSVALYPIGLMGAKTPRGADYAELVQPPVFSYGLYLPSAILIFMICIVYSVLRSSWQILLSGLAYYVMGYFCYKYQLLYAMDHRQHSTGKSWVQICDRIIVGLVVFQLTMAGQLALRGAVRRSIVVFPLLVLTIWFSQVYGRSYKPLMDFIALRSIRRAEHDDPGAALRYESETHRRLTIDESRESGMRFINPSMIAPLEDVWILDKGARSAENSGFIASRVSLDGEAEN
ncbi:DUF221-domain-containing protein [Rhizodiscina lignyota]|uniref:DUF221-domain-containing protein n=1 Tax=Rhizodiscina lignyota TaxID=1504668 RepID=A0A9P4I840_9PEZI|nr:DUF221-domain-containing protein [Rhizodiscina lignyota]